MPRDDYKAFGFGPKKVVAAAKTPSHLSIPKKGPMTETKKSAAARLRMLSYFRRHDIPTYSPIAQAIVRDTSLHSLLREHGDPALVLSHFLQQDEYKEWVDSGVFQHGSGLSVPPLVHSLVAEFVRSVRDVGCERYPAFRAFVQDAGKLMEALRNETPAEIIDSLLNCPTEMEIGTVYDWVWKDETDGCTRVDAYRVIEVTESRFKVESVEDEDEEYSYENSIYDRVSFRVRNDSE